MRVTQRNGIAALTLLMAGHLVAACQAQPIEAVEKGTSSLGDCKPHDEIPPPPIDALNGGACPAVGSDCQNVMPVSLCLVGERRMVLVCDTVNKTWKVSLQECLPDGGTSDGAGTTADAAPLGNTPPGPCKARDDIPPPPPTPMAGVGPDGVCPAEGTACSHPVALCTDKEGHRMYMECDRTKHTWYIVFQQCF
jgi:hypothetical protein